MLTDTTDADAQTGCDRTVSKPYLFWSLGLAFERKADAQVVVNKIKRKEAIEALGLSHELAKQVLSQLSYTPTDFKS